MLCKNHTLRTAVMQFEGAGTWREKKKKHSLTEALNVNSLQKRISGSELV